MSNPSITGHVSLPSACRLVVSESNVPGNLPADLETLSAIDAVGSLAEMTSSQEARLQIR